MRKRAFTLLEVMIGVSLISLIAISVLPAISFSFKSRKQLKEKSFSDGGGENYRKDKS